MTEGVETATPPPPKPNSIARIIGVFATPGETLPEIARRPDILVPLAILLVISLFGGIVMAQKVDFASVAREATAGQPTRDMSPKQLEAQETARHWMVAIWRVSAYCAPVFSAISLVILAAILLAAFKLMGGEGEFLQALSVTIYAWYPLLIKGVLALIVLISRKTITLHDIENPVMSNLAFLVNAKQHPIAAAFLGNFDLFSLWTMVLLIIGFAAISGFSRAKSAAIVISLWSVKVLFSLAGGAMQAMRMKAS
jgi:hypothetical protein